MNVPPVVEPAEFLDTVVVGLLGQVVKGIPQEMDVAALPGGFGQHLEDRFLESGMIVGDDELDPVQAVFRSFR